MFRKVLVANRGEIALRVISACRELGIATVAVHSEADRDALHVRLRRRGRLHRAAPPAGFVPEHHLDHLGRGEITEADAVHPGYGFLSENAHFAEILQDVGLTFIGPVAGRDPDDGRQVARAATTAARRGRADRTGVRRRPSRRGDEALTFAGRIGYPVILKASAGGGGRGMRVARNEKDLAAAYEIARGEAEKAFGNAEVYLEKYLAEPRHVEFQVFGDRLGQLVHLGERECSIQRRHQKLLEESPSAGRRRRISGAGWAPPRSRRRAPSPTSGPARSNSCSTRTARSTSWR